MNVGILSVLIFLTSCFFSSNSIKQIFSEPKYEEKKASLIFLISNGFSGQLTPKENVKHSSNFNEVPNISIGGERAFFSYFSISKEKYNASALLLDSGNLFKSGSSEAEKEKVLKLYEQIGYDAVALSQKDLKDISPFEGEKEYKVPFVLSNIVEIKKLKRFKKNGVVPYKIIKKGPYNIGIINITSMKKFKAGLYMEDPILAIIKIGKKFRRKNVDFTVLMADINSKCKSPPAQSAKSFKDFSKHQLKCPTQDPLLSFVKRLPPNSVDLILSNNKIEAQGFLRNIPIVQTTGDGRFLARVLINVSNEDKKLDQKHSFILPPILTCNNFFGSTKDCYLGEGENYFSKENARMEIIRKSSYKMVPATYLGKQIPISDNLVTN
jgi:2',3'-cyclic-nucleotide 2'-phosphodiesterase (5'-nucleotidase family)